MNHDVLLKRYLSDNRRYADLINGFAFGGKQIVKEEDLSELDTQSGFYPWELSGILRKKKSGQKGKRTGYRDLFRRVAFGVNFVVIGVENQKEVHYLMPVRSMGYDVREYEKQAALLAKKVRKRESLKQAEFLSGFTQKDKLKPCITFVFYYGDDWDGSMDLHGLLDFTGMPPEIKELVGNYKINLMNVKKLESVDAFQTDLKQILNFIKYSKDKHKLKELTEQDPTYAELEEDAYDVAVTLTGAEEMLGIKNRFKKEGKVNMCRAIAEMIEDGREEGREEIICHMIQIGKEFGGSREDVCNKVIEKCKMEKEKAEEYMEKYW